MTWTDVVQLISTVGFPIVCCVLLGWYIKYSNDKEREERAKMTEEHKAEMLGVTTAVNNNTLALQRLCDKLDN